MFVAAITWVYFHEIGHLLQEHGVIRTEFASVHSDAVASTDVHDLEASNHNLLVGREALISHVTELAADSEATSICVSELLRHVSHPDLVSENDRTEVLSGLIYLMVCSLALLFFRFNGKQPIHQTAIIEGSHPKPLTRLEFNVPKIFESLDMIGKLEVVSHGLDRKQLVLLCAKATLSTTLFWTMTKTDKPEIDDRFLPKGLLTNSDVLEYFQKIVGVWDEISPRVKEIRRFGYPLGFMTFTDSFRLRIANGMTWGKGPEGKSITSSPPDAISQ